MLLKVLKFLQLLLTDLYVKALRLSYSQRLQKVAEITTVIRQHDAFREVLITQSNNLVTEAGEHNMFVSKELTKIGR